MCIGFNQGVVGVDRYETLLEVKIRRKVTREGNLSVYDRVWVDVHDGFGFGLRFGLSVGLSLGLRSKGQGEGYGEG